MWFHQNKCWITRSRLNKPVNEKQLRLWCERNERVFWALNVRVNSKNQLYSVVPLPWLPLGEEPIMLPMEEDSSKCSLVSYYNFWLQSFRFNMSHFPHNVQIVVSVIWFDLMPFRIEVHYGAIKPYEDNVCVCLWLQPRIAGQIAKTKTGTKF